ncbi:NHL repeat containing protein [Thermincola potens JR]|uniref:NHL repeat containing protein n=1 Tax=Thermincola potens (strain JR) TaxID=635013 RepID=D5XF56_THEPJ|nr:NHL repeat containing protein [Thermincola potens JR]
MSERKKVTINLRTYLALLTVIVIITAALFTYLFYNRRSTLPAISVGPIPGNFNFVYNIYGSKDRKLLRPMSAFFEHNSKKIYVANTEGHSIDVFDNKGKYLYSFGGFGSIPGKLSYPYGIARLSDGNIVVTEAGNRRVQKFSPQGDFLGFIVPTDNAVGLDKPGPVRVDARGNIYIGDLSGNKVIVLDATGKLIRTVGNVQYPHGIALDEKNNRLYVASAGTGNIKVFPLTENKKEDNNAPEFSGLGLVRGIDVDEHGNLYVVDSIAGMVRTFDFNGKPGLSFGGSGNDDGSMLYPNGIDVGEDGRVYVADWGNNRIVVWGN